VLADEANGYARRDEVLAGGVERAGAVGLWLTVQAGAVTVGRLPGQAVYPRRYDPVRLFTLLPGQVGRYRANFRFRGCQCSAEWWYESWLLHVSNAPAEPGRFVRGVPDRDGDVRVHLYGGARRSGADRQHR